jgi:3'(2'), 5'-bisphosphate nucleotidase
LIVGEESTGQLRTPEQAHVLEAVIDEVRAYRKDATADDVLRAIDSCNHDARGGGYWALDPIDGTKGFLRGQQYAIALARIERGQVVLGVMGCPNLAADHNAPLDVADSRGTIYAATLNNGSWEHESHDPTSQCRQIRAAHYDGSRPVRACESVEAAHSKQDTSARILEELGAAGTPARLDSQCKYAIVARGQADVYLRIPTSKTYVERIWDHAAGAIIATEAGAIVSDITGAPLDFTHGRLLSANRGIVCAARGVHERVIGAIERLGIEAPV